MLPEWADTYVCTTQSIAHSVPILSFLSLPSFVGGNVDRGPETVALKLKNVYISLFNENF